MKNRDLIKKLSEFNLDADVSLTTSEDIAISYISDDSGDKKSTIRIFIEGIDECPYCIHEYKEDNEKQCDFYGMKCTDVEECYNFQGLDE